MEAVSVIVHAVHPSAFRLTVLDRQLELHPPPPHFSPADASPQICKANGYSSDTGGPMTVVHGKLEELPGLPAGVEQVCLVSVCAW